jgi:hypothetical protein
MFYEFIIILCIAGCKAWYPTCQAKAKTKAKTKGIEDTS